MIHRGVGQHNSELIPLDIHAEIYMIIEACIKIELEAFQSVHPSLMESNSFLRLSGAFATTS